MEKPQSTTGCLFWMCPGTQLDAEVLQYGPWAPAVSSFSSHLDDGLPIHLCSVINKMGRVGKPTLHICFLQGHRNCLFCHFYRQDRMEDKHPTTRWDTGHKSHSSWFSSSATPHQESVSVLGYKTQAVQCLFHHSSSTFCPIFSWSLEILSWHENIGIEQFPSLVFEENFKAQTTKHTEENHHHHH